MRFSNSSFAVKFLILLSLFFIFSIDAEATTARDPEYTYTTSSYTVYTDISEDGRYMASVDNGGKIYFHDVLNNTLLWQYDTGTVQLQDLDISFDGSYILHRQVMLTLVGQFICLIVIYQTMKNCGSQL